MRFIAASVVLALAAMVAQPGANRMFVLTARQPLASTVTSQGYTVVRAYPHDADAFTQGLLYLDGFLYEGTGLNGRSSIRKVRLETGEVLQRRDIDPQHFGEGITILGDDLYQLTWQSGTAFVYDRATFARKRAFRYTGEGWGLTHDGTNLIMSDGTAYLRLIDPIDFREIRRIRVTSLGAPLDHLNELEYVRGEVLANIWLTDRIARIDPATGRVTGYVDLSGLLHPRDRREGAILNGIAYDAARDRLFVTGKFWPRLFEIALTVKAR